MQLGMIEFTCAYTIVYATPKPLHAINRMLGIVSRNPLLLRHVWRGKMALAGNVTFVFLQCDLRMVVRRFMGLDYANVLPQCNTNGALQSIRHG